jgi:hypothetical protein
MSTGSKLPTVAFFFEVCDTPTELQRDYQVFQDPWYADAMKQCNVDISSSDAYKTSVNCVALRCSKLDDVYFLLSCVSQRLNRAQTTIQESIMNAKVYDTSKQVFNIHMRDLPLQVRNFFSKNNTNPVTVVGQDSVMHYMRSRQADKKVKYKDEWRQQYEELCNQALSSKAKSDSKQEALGTDTITSFATQQQDIAAAESAVNNAVSALLICMEHLHNMKEPNIRRHDKCNIQPDHVHCGCLGRNNDCKCLCFMHMRSKTNDIIAESVKERVIHRLQNAKSKRKIQPISIH